MCTYCMIADHARIFWPDPANPPWKPPQFDPLAPEPFIRPPRPVQPRPWTREELESFMDLLERVRKLEEKVDPCPCPDASKTDFLKAIKERLDAIDEKLTSKPPDAGAT